MILQLLIELIEHRRHSNQRNRLQCWIPYAGAKADPTRVKVADVSEASTDPLARKVRQLLRQKHEIVTGLPVVLSAEKPRCPLIPVEELSHAPHELQVILGLYVICGGMMTKEALKWFMGLTIDSLVTQLDRFLLVMHNQLL